MVGWREFWQTSRPMRERPLSPHLSVYKFKYTLLSSILNRLTGIVLSVGLLLLVYWLGSLVCGPAAYTRAVALLGLPLFKLIYAALLVAFVYHLCAGIRHLIWDTAVGMERVQAYRSAWMLAIATLVISLVLGYLLFCPHAGVPTP